MNIFLPYENDIERSVAALDDRRLIKQILECKQLLEVAIGQNTGWSNHPVAVHYRKYPEFIACYGYAACAEFWFRFDKNHALDDYFTDAFTAYKPAVPFYAEYPATDPRCIRPTENVTALFQAKLVRKWNTDKISPKWTNRERPEFYK